MDNNGCQPTEIGHLSDSGELIKLVFLYLTRKLLTNNNFCVIWVEKISVEMKI